MQLREVNVNSHAVSAAGARKPAVAAAASTATYISPPRNPIATSANSRIQTRARRAAVAEPTHTEPVSATPEETAESHYYYNASDATAAAAASMMSPEEFAAYGQCPCPTCAYYRAYYAQQMGYCCFDPAEAAAVAAQHRLMMIPPSQFPTFRQQQQQQQTGYLPGRPTGSMPIMSMRTKQEQPETVSTVAAAPAARQAVPVAPTEGPLDAFFTEFIGHVADRACTPTGKATLQSLLRHTFGPAAAAATADCPSLREDGAAMLAAMVRELAADIDTVALDANGCHVLRAAVDVCSAEQTAQLVAALHETLVLNMCTVSQYTRRTLQTLFQRALVDLAPLVDILSRNAAYLAATQQGCIALMRVYELCNEEQQAMLVQPLLPSFHTIALDPFGNYVVQCAIEHSGTAVAAQYTISCFAGHLLTMSCNKFASNVVEKVIRSCYDVPAVRRMLLDELIFNPAALQELVKDGYGNFVVQSIIDTSNQAAELKRIHDRLKPALAISPYASKIEAKIKSKKPQQQQQQQVQQQSYASKNSSSPSSRHHTRPGSVVFDSAETSCPSLSLPSFQATSVSTNNTAHYPGSPAAPAQPCVTYPLSAQQQPTPADSPCAPPSISTSKTTASSSATSISSFPAPPSVRGWQPPQHTIPRLGAGKRCSAVSL